MIGYCKLCFNKIENEEYAEIHFKVFHNIIFMDGIISIEELIQD
jgi:hypothetical protein